MIRALGCDRRGITAAEFAMMLPAMLMLMMGLGELAYTAYVRAILAGAMQKAGRDSGIQGGDQQTSVLDGKVIAAVRKVLATVSYTSSRVSYAQYGYTSGEPFTDSNGNGIRDAGECYTDTNRNNQYDTNPGVSGQGGASDVAIYTMTLSYPRLFPVARLIGLTNTATLTSTVVLKNQPYATQATPPTICT